MEEFLFIFMFSFRFLCSALCYLVWLFSPNPHSPFSILPCTPAFAPLSFSHTHTHPHTHPHTHTHTHTHTFQPFSPLLFTSFVYEIRWFLLGEASVHPSAAPSCPCPTPSIQVIQTGKLSLSLFLSLSLSLPPSLSLSITYCFISTLFSMYIPVHMLWSTPWQTHLWI